MLGASVTIRRAPPAGGRPTQLAPPAAAPLEETGSSSAATAARRRPAAVASQDQGAGRWARGSRIMGAMAQATSDGPGVAVGAGAGRADGGGLGRRGGEVHGVERVDVAAPLVGDEAMVTTECHVPGRDDGGRVDRDQPGGGAREVHLGEAAGAERGAGHPERGAVHGDAARVAAGGAERDVADRRAGGVDDRQLAGAGRIGEVAGGALLQVGEHHVDLAAEGDGAAREGQAGGVGAGRRRRGRWACRGRAAARRPRRRWRGRRRRARRPSGPAPGCR